MLAAVGRVELFHTGWVCGYDAWVLYEAAAQLRAGGTYCPTNLFAHHVSFRSQPRDETALTTVLSSENAP